MAGALIPASSEHLETTTTMTTTETMSDSHCLSHLMPIVAVIDQWEVVEYARFVNYPPLDRLSSTHPSLTPYTLRFRKRSRGGAWIKNSADGGGASLKLIPSRSTGFDDVVLVVSLRHNILEEHYVSRLHFSWPQVSCVSGIPSRGTRAVLVSYKDSGGQIQKFALRFSTIDETEKFISVLKKVLDYARPGSLLCAELGSEVSSQSEFVPSNYPSQKSADEGWRHMAAIDFPNTNQIEESKTATAESSRTTSGNYGVAQASGSREMILHHEAEEILSAFPPSFTSFLINCCPTAEQGVVKPSMSENVDIKNDITKYLKDPSFQDVLMKAEQLISQLGDDILF